MAAAALAAPDPDRNQPRQFKMTNRILGLLQQSVNAANSADTNPGLRDDLRTFFDVAQAFRNPNIHPDLRSAYVEVLVNKQPVGGLRDAVNTAVWNVASRNVCWSCAAGHHDCNGHCDCYDSGHTLLAVN
jgi:hypothetical protein